MRPRFFNRGEAGARQGALQRDDASMRPRFFNRGEAAKNPGRAGQIALQ
jgi:hypothetical protein